MKQTTQNTFSDGMNLDLHPIVTPNSVLTDNLNGTFITYNGNEFCLQNDRGNTLKATLTEGFVPIGIKEHNGVLYIVSHNKNTGESEIGTFPGVDWSVTKERWRKFDDQLGYQPMKNLIKNPVFYTKEMVEVHNFASTWWNFEVSDAYIDKLNSTFDGFVERLKQVSGWDDGYLKDIFFRDPMIDPNFSPAVISFLQDVVNGIQCKDTYGRVPLWKNGEPNLIGQQSLCIWSSFLGDNTDSVKFNTFYDHLQKIFDYASEHAGTGSQWERETRLNQYIIKYAFSMSDWYNMFSYDGLTLSYDYPWNGSGVKYEATEIADMLEIIFAIAYDNSDHWGWNFGDNQNNNYNIESIVEVNTGTINWDETHFEEFRSASFGFDLEHPVEVEIQDSYDGSVNLILSDGKNKPKIVNSEFSVNGDQYKLIRRAQKDYLIESLLETQTSLIKNPISFSKFELVDILSGGQLKGGNYTFYAKLGDADGNQTDIVSESGLVSVFKGTVGVPNTISGTLADERTDKIVSLKLTKINDGYSKVYLYYVREFSDTEGYLMEEAAMISKPYDVLEINGTYYCDILVTGYEDTTSISIEDLNIRFHTNESVKTMAQQQNMLFLGNVVDTTYDYSQLDKFAKKIKTCISNVEPVSGSSDNITPITSDYSTDGEYYNIYNIYSKVGYWPKEYYRFGVVFILNNGQTSDVFNMNGGEVAMNVLRSSFSGSCANEYGVFLTPDVGVSPIIKTGTITPWHFKFDCSEMVQEIIDQEYGDIIKGYFIVRQKRIPEVITQGIRVKIDESAHVPTLSWTYNNSVDNVLESFVTMTEDGGVQKTTLIYSPESVSGEYIRPTNDYYIAYDVTLMTYSTPDETGYAIGGFLTLGIGWLFFKLAVQTRTEHIYAIVRYNSDGEMVDVHMQESNQNSYECRNGGKYWFDYDKYHSGYEPSYSSNPWVTHQTSSGPGGQTTDYYYYTDGSEWRKLKAQALDDNGYIANMIRTNYPKDTNGVDTAVENFESHLVNAITSDSCSGILSEEAILTPNIKNRLNGNSVSCDTLGYASMDNQGRTYISGRHQTLIAYNTNLQPANEVTQAVYINSNNSGKAIGDKIFATVVGSAYDASNVVEVSRSASVEERRRNVIRGKFTPYIGLTSGWTQSDKKQFPIIQLSDRQSVDSAVKIRTQDNSPYYCVSERTSLGTNATIDVYRGDCYVVTETIRINYNFIDPNYPFTEAIAKKFCWENYLAEEGGTTNWDEINATDLNTVSLGHWITFKCLASSNLGLRSEDPFDVTAVNIMGNPRSFYPLSGSTSTAGKQLDSELFNSGYGVGVGKLRRQQYIEVPYVKQEYSNRVMFSNKHVTDEFVNGYRVFQGLSYQDYDKQYGPIVKLEPWGNNLLCVFEHGIALLPINEKALLQTTTEQTIHIYGHGVLPEQMSIVSQDYGTRYADSVLRTPIGIYGVDTDAKKIWRFSDKQGFETLSDMKIETFLNNNLFARYDIEIDKCDIRTHYNSFKGDVMFTWYYTENHETHVCSICYNERQGLWTTRYDWVPLVSENSNGEFYSLQRGADSIVEDYHYVDKVGIYSHAIEEARPTKWYGEQHPFEYEFVVSDPIGAMKIYENLQIISNNVQPEELQFEFIGDSYFFNKARIYHSVYENSFAETKRFGNEVTRNLKLYLTDPSRRTENIETIYNKPNIILNQDENEYKPFRNASILNDRDSEPIYGRVLKTENATEEYRLRIPQECRNIEPWGRRLGNMHYKEGIWHTNIEPVLYDARLNNPIITTLNTPATKWNSARIRDKWCKIRVRYSGEDLAVITAIKTIVNI